MTIVSQKSRKRSQSKLTLAFLAFIVVIAFPILAFSSRETKLYVDAKASGAQTGAIDKPFKTIKQAMDLADENTEIHVANGTYQENIIVKKGVEVYGESKEGVVVSAQDKNDPAATMKHKTKIDKVTLRGGRFGIKVEKNAKASIIDCVVKENKKDGINIKSGDVKKSRMVSISESVIRDNGRAGIYSQKRRLSIEESEIIDNDGDGIDIESGSSGWIANSKIKDNEKSGMKLRIDGSNIWLEDNSIRGNDREGIEISFGGKAGRINVADSKITDNGRYGIARIQKFAIAGSGNLWAKYLTFNDKNKFSKNKRGNISNIIIVK